jgi:hypothetical protein
MIEDSASPVQPAPRSPAEEERRRRRAAREKRLSGSRRIVGAVSLVLTMTLLLAAKCTDETPGGKRSARPSPGTLSSCPVMREGDSGECVRAMQNALFIARGENLRADGSFGSGTATAVRGFQGDKGLGVDGVAGSETLDALDRALPVDHTRALPNGVLACGNLFGSCTFYFDRPTTHTFYLKVKDQTVADAAKHCAVFLLGGPQAAAVCGLFQAVKLTVVRSAAKAADRDDACLAVRFPVGPSAIPYVSSHNGRNCTGPKHG